MYYKAEQLFVTVDGKIKPKKVTVIIQGRGFGQKEFMRRIQKLRGSNGKTKNARTVPVKRDQ